MIRFKRVLNTNNICKNCQKIQINGMRYMSQIQAIKDDNVYVNVGSNGNDGLTDVIMNANCNDIGNILKNAKILDRSVFVAGLNKCIQENGYQYCDEIMEILMNNGIKPNFEELKLGVTGLIKSDNIDKAKGYLKLMVNDHDSKPTQYKAHTLIDISLDLEDIQFAQSFFKRMLDNNMAPYGITYSRFLVYYCEQNELENLEKFFQDYVLRSSVINKTILWNSYINIYSNKGDLQGMNKVLGMMAQHKIKYRPSTYGCILKCFIQADKPELGISLINEMKKRNTELTHENDMPGFNVSKISTYSSMMKKTNNIGEREKYLNEIKSIIEVTEIGVFNKKSILLENTFLCYYDNNMNRVIQCFEDNFDESIYFKYLGSDTENSRIKLYYFRNNISVVFALRYICMKKMNTNIITNYVYIDTFSMSFAMMLMKELNSWTPKINAVLDVTRKNIIKIPNTELIEWLNNKPDNFLDFNNYNWNSLNQEYYKS